MKKMTDEEHVAMIPLIRALGNFLAEHYDRNKTTVGDVFKTEAQLEEFARQKLTDEQYQKLVELGLVALQ